MRYKEHGVPHFHAYYGEHVASISANSGRIIEGYLPSKQMQFVKAWFLIHQDQLLENWDNMRDGIAPGNIPPLR